jgi:two-component system, cell cycle sensor histidine kinase and response regulator CckA
MAGLARRRCSIVSSPRTFRVLRPADTTILVVDDDQLMLRLVEHTLRSEGYRVWTASRAADARNVLAQLAGAVDLVLTDVAMPGELGSELADEIRSSTRWVRVLYMSRYSGEELRDRGIEISPVQLLKKPFMPAQLLARVHEAMST